MCYVIHTRYSLWGLQIDSPYAGGHISRATQKFGTLRIADCDCVLLESDDVAFVAQLSN
jgi:hypothetical protein